MNAALRNLILSVLPVATLGSGCLHHVAATPASSGVLACQTQGDETSCVESSRFDGSGTLRHHVVERTTPGERCDLVVVEQASFDATGVLVQRVVEDRRCRVVDRSVSTRYDMSAGIVEHRVQRDDDHDAEIDFDRVVRVPMTKQVRALAKTTGAARMARLEAVIAADEGTDGAPDTAPSGLLATTRR
jgi:hypothetical protein